MLVAPVNKAGETALHIALKYKHPSEVVLSILAKAPAAAEIQDSRDGMMPLHLCLYKQHPSGVILNVLAASRTACSAADNDGDTPLHLACYKGPFELQVVNALLQAEPAAASSIGEAAHSWTFIAASHQVAPLVQ